MIRWTLIATVMFALAGLGCERPIAAPPAMHEVRAEGEPVQESWDVRFSVNESPLGQEATLPRLELQAAYMAAYEQGDTTFTVLHGGADSTEHRVTALIFDAAGDTSATVRADRMIYHEYDRRFEARGAVTVATAGGRHLETEELYWNERDETVRAPGFARITTATERIQGYGLVADEQLETYTLARVTGQVTLEEE